MTMPAPGNRLRAQRLAMPLVAMACVLAGCLQPYEARHESQWNSRDQIWLSEPSQVKLRAAQSRVFEDADRLQILTAVVATMQDLGFMIEEVDERLGLVYGRRFDPLESSWIDDPSYHLYDERRMLVFTRAMLGWAPFEHRSNLVRLTVTVRKRNDAQMVVRASSQYSLRAVEDPAAYQRFFAAVAQKLSRAARPFDEIPG